MKKNFLIGLSIICVYICCACSNSNEIYMFEMNNQYLSGIYEGERQEKKPEGVGAFIATENKDEIERYNGKWRAGLPDGEGKIIYRNGCIFEGTFHAGKKHGMGTTIYADGSYSKVRYKDDKAYGRKIFYDSNGEKQKVEYCYDGRTLSEIKQEIVEFSYEDVLSDPKAYRGTIVCIEGKIKIQYETIDRSYIVLEDSRGKIFIIYYDESVGSIFEQVYVPNNLKIGEKIVIYGTIDDCNDEILYKKDSETVFFKRIDGTRVFVNAISIEREGIIIPDEITYETLNVYMDYFREEEYSDSGKIKNIVVEYEKNRIYYAIENKKGQIYYLVKRHKKEGEIYSIGETVTFVARGKGYYKVVADEENTAYQKYPLLIIKKVERENNGEE